MPSCNHYWNNFLKGIRQDCIKLDRIVMIYNIVYLISIDLSSCELRYWLNTIDVTIISKAVSNLAQNIHKNYLWLFVIVTSKFNIMMWPDFLISLSPKLNLYDRENVINQATAMICNSASKNIFCKEHGRSFYGWICRHSSRYVLHIVKHLVLVSLVVYSTLPVKRHLLIYATSVIYKASHSTYKY